MAVSCLYIWWVIWLSVKFLGQTSLFLELQILLPILVRLWVLIWIFLVEEAETRIVCISVLSMTNFSNGPIHSFRNFSFRKFFFQDIFLLGIFLLVLPAYLAIGGILNNLFVQSDILCLLIRPLNWLTLNMMIMLYIDGFGLIPIFGLTPLASLSVCLMTFNFLSFLFFTLF